MAEKKEKRYVSDNAQLMTEWDWGKNNALGLDPSRLTYGSGKKAHWKCASEHTWVARIDHRSNGVGCPYCSQKACWSGENDLLTLQPNIAEEWCYEKNALTPNMIAVRSNKVVWWVCKYGHQWQASVSNRVAGNSCPYCAGKLVLEGFNDLKTLNPILANDWNYSRNAPLLPTQVTSKSNKKVWWICNNGHEWEATINNRARGNGCPVCANKSVVSGFNDFSHMYPDLSAEWNYEKNGDLAPEDFVSGSGRKVWWTCKRCGHEWERSIVSRVRGGGCPKCFDRNRTSFPEQAIYYYINQIFFDSQNRCTTALEAKKELDIFIPQLHIAIEYDGAFWHKGNGVKEISKYNACKKHGIFLIRVKEAPSDWDVKSCDLIIYNNETLENVIKKIGIVLEVEFDCDLERDRADILKQFYQSVRERSLLIQRPDLAKEWNYIANRGLTPDMFYEFSNEKVWWKCKNGHEWEASISNRSHLGRGCPYCAGQKAIVGVNDLFSLFPMLRNEWDECKNGLSTIALTTGSNKRVWWKCTTCGHEWQATINHRTSGRNCPKCGIVRRGKARTKEVDAFATQVNASSPKIMLLEDYNGVKSKILVKCKICGYEWKASPSSLIQGVGCPACANRVVMVGKNDLQSQYPAVAKDWDYSKNQGTTPESVVYGSSKKVHWKCTICQNEWQDSVEHRTSGRGCPKCAKENRNKTK